MLYFNCISIYFYKWLYYIKQQTKVIATMTTALTILRQFFLNMSGERGLVG